MQNFQIIQKVQQQDDNDKFQIDEEQIHNYQFNYIPIKNEQSLKKKMLKHINNLTYSLRHNNILSIRKKQQPNLNTTGYLLGKQFQNETQFNIRFRQICWFTYRDKLSLINTDMGWGCMIRVGQMIISACLYQIYQSYQFLNDFIDSKIAKLSLQLIAISGNLVNKFSNAHKVLLTIDKLIPKKYKLKIISISKGIIITSKILEQIDSCLKIQPDTKFLIVFHTMLGIEKLNQVYVPYLEQLIKFPNFIGIMCGKSNNALYIVGVVQQPIILDPHYVQEACHELNQNNITTYFKSTPRGIQWNCLNSAFGIGFLIYCRQNLFQMEEKIKKLNSKFAQCETCLFWTQQLS